MSTSSTTTITTKSPEELAAELQAELESHPRTVVNTQEVENEEINSLDETKYLTIRRLKAEVEKLEQDNEGRRVFRDGIFAVTVIWMFLILVIVWHEGAGNIRLSDTVLVALITTTTANVFGFLYVVVNYLYNKDKST